MNTVPPNLFLILSENFLTFLFRHVSHSQPLFSIFVTRGRDKHIINNMFLSLFFHLYLLPYFFFFFLNSVQLPFSSLLFGVWPDQRGAKEGGGGGLIKGKNVAIVLSRYVCICDKQKERKGERGEQG